MKLLIHDLTAAEWARTAEEYQGWTVLSDTGTIRPCIGCFRCWTGGVGECVCQDDYHRMYALIHEADEMVVMSRYTYGGFSSFVKNVFDRSLGYVLPEFETAYGEMHHKKRFPEDKPITFCFRGTGLTPAEKEKAQEYVAAVCRNLRGTVKEVLFEECAAVESPGVYDAAHAKRAGILFINCSLRGQRSNTGIFLQQLQDALAVPVDTVNLTLGGDITVIANAMRKAANVVLGVPLYVDGLPAPAIRFMETVQQLHAGTGCRLYALVNNGLYESSQNSNLLSMIRDFCAANGIRYCGSVAIGAGEAVGTMMRWGSHSLWPARNAKKGIARLADAIEAGSGMDDLYADPFAFPRRLYITIANTNWQKLKRADQAALKAKRKS